jgi:hypothetical protein
MLKQVMLVVKLLGEYDPNGERIIEGILGSRR